MVVPPSFIHLIETQQRRPWQYRPDVLVILTLHRRPLHLHRHPMPPHLVLTSPFPTNMGPKFLGRRLGLLRLFGVYSCGGRCCAVGRHGL